MKKTIKFTTDEMHDYLARWKKDDVIDDFIIAHDRGYDEICAYIMQSSGALSIYSPIEKAIMTRKISDTKFRKLCQECFEDCLIYTNPKSNESYWVPTKGDLSYFTDEKDLFRDGYTNKRKFGQKD